MQKKIAAFFVIALALLGANLLSSEKPDANPLVKSNVPSKISETQNATVRIGVFEPLSGSNQEGGLSELEGIQLAHELYPMVNGNRIELYIEDNESDRYKTVESVMKLIETHKADVLIGSWGSSYALAAGPVINEEEIPTVGASCTNPKITIGNAYYSRVSYVDTFQGTAVAQFAFRDLKAKTAAILMEEDNEYSIDLGEYFTNAFAELNNYQQSILLEDYYKPGQTDFTELLSKVKLRHPDILFVPGNYEEVAEIAKEANAQGIQSKILGTDTLDTENFSSLVAENTNRIYFSTFYSHEFSETEEAKKFLLAYRNKYQKDPNSFSALGYDAYLLIYDALKRVGKIDPVQINNAIHSARNVEGAAGYITMDQNGDTKRGVVIKQINEGKAHYVTSIDPDN